ncbi:autophagy protein-like protein 5 [Bimuria novae-zelandiae CBS 107.79]|uniref:Autophagy protein 5 n=1 Tax=Bimuria novae-zelandiae CBS 107.79 TaxID=1447943 RepID=A0A6A5VE12_9PLEO|nr:autophagy protein-like protein 5 [Bimuria novae-zelandiae CBS 107.79]
MSNRDTATWLRERVWHASIPLEIRLHKADSSSYDSDAYLVHFPRLSYLAFLLPELHTFFYNDLIYPDVSWADAWLEYDGVPLKWHYPLGLLHDLYSGAAPVSAHDTSEEKETPSWQLTVHFSKYPEDQLVRLDTDGKHLRDLFTNNVKEADYLRNGTGRTMMFLGKQESQDLWEGVRKHDFNLFHPIYTQLMNPKGVALRHVPVRLYLPHAADPQAEEEITPGSVRVVQELVPLNTSSRQPQTVGSALNSIMGGLFPNKRLALVAEPVLHGATLPLDASVEDLMRTSAYCDGWLHIAFALL